MTNLEVARAFVGNALAYGKHSKDDPIGVLLFKLQTVNVNLASGEARRRESGIRLGEFQMTRAEKIAAKKLDAEINKLYCENCSGIQIDIMDISKVFDVAKKARAEGRDMKDAIVSFVQTIRKN
jgi:hypothetical protein